MFKYLTSSDLIPAFFPLLEEEGFADYVFPVNTEPLSHELMQMSGLQHKVC